MKKLLVLAGCALLITTPAFAQSATERAAAIKEWRANCSDPDPDLLVAYIEGAIESADRTIIRTCLKQALLSENEDVRNTALRGALAANDTLVLRWDMPKTYYIDIEKADGDAEAINKLNRYAWSDHLNDTKRTNGQMSFIANSVAASDKNSKWYTIWANTKRSDSHFVDVNVTGSSLNGQGRLAFGDSNSGFEDFTINLKLSEAGKLDGTGQIGNSSNFQVSIDLF